FTGALTAAAANGKEVEIVEYRNGDSQHRQRVIFEGRDRNALIARVLRVGPVDPGDVDGDGLPEVGRREGRPAVAGAAARRSKQAESATHAATVVLVANSRDGVNALQLLWQARGGGPRAMSVQYLAAGSAPRSSSVSVRLERCRPFRFTQKSAPGSGAYTDYE